MKKVLFAAMILFAVTSCKKESAKMLSGTNSVDTTFIIDERVYPFHTPEAGFRLDFTIINCKSANIELNTNDAKGWKPQETAIGVDNGLLIFLYYFRYRFNVVRNNGTTWVSSERICQF
jgi:hypothetical protein